MSTHSRSAQGQVLLASVGLLSFTQVMAQEADPADLEQVVVVGSRIPQAPNQIPSVTVLTSEQIEQRGYATVQQALDDLPQNSGGGIDQQAGLFTFVPSAAGLNLRDMGLGRALILLDGHRLPMFPIGWNGTDSFIDISSIPAGAVERIEILNDGASAIYGSDAMSGVISVTLKKRANNEVSVRYGDTTQGGGAEKRVQLSAGAQAEGSDASVFVEYYHRDPLMYSQRERTRSDRLGGINGSGPGLFSNYGYLGTSVGSTITTPGGCDTSGGSPGISASGICLFNRAPYRQVWPKIDSLSATAKFDQELVDSLSWFTLVNLRNAKTYVQFEPLDFDKRDVGIFSSPLYFRRLVELGAQRADYNNISYNVHTGLKGKVTDRFEWQFTLQAATLQLEVSERGLIRNDQMADALNGLIDFNGDGVPDPLDLSKPIPAATAAQLEYRPQSRSESSIRGAEWLGTGDLFALPGGTAKLATTLEYFWEDYFDHPDPELVAGNVSVRQAADAGGRRTRNSVGLELQLPVIRQLQVNLAGRYDKYQDDSKVGGAVSPRVEVKYRPGSTWLIRGSAGRSFRAPDLQRLYGGASRGFNEVVDTPQCVADGGKGRGDAAVPSCVTPVFAQVTRNSSLALQEERGTNYNLGVFWKPLPQWSASLDYFNIKLRNVVQTPDDQYVLDEYAARRSFANLVSFGFNASCPFTEVCLDLQPVNIAYKKVSGLDGTTDYQWSTGLGQFNAGIKASYLFDVTMRESAVRAPINVLQLGTLGEAVRFKGDVDLGWRRGPWGTNIYLNYMGGFAPATTTTQQHIGSFTTVNVSASYKLVSTAVAQVGVNNVFNRMPPVDIQNGNLSAPFYHQQFHNVNGANWYVSFRQPF